MAFDHPLEADRVDDLNFFTTIVRAPVVGALFWFLGGEEAKQRNEEEKRLFQAQLYDDEQQQQRPPSSPTRSRRREVEGGDDGDDDRSASSSDLDKQSASLHSRGHNQFAVPLSSSKGLRKAPPSMAESDISSVMGSSLPTLDDGVGECGESLDRMTLREEGGGNSTTFAVASSSSLKRKKELSWSDESGHELVEFVGEPSRHETNVRVTDSRAAEHHQLHHHNHHHHHRKHAPGGGMSRSRSVRANMVTDDAASARLQHSSEPPPSRYLPRGLDKAHNGIILPRMPYGAQVEPSASVDGVGGAAQGGGGVESPQWGWFLRTTPPTPQMYYPRASTSLQRHATASTGSSMPAGGATTYDPAAVAVLPPPPPPPPAAFVGATTTNPAPLETTNLKASPRPNPIFQGLQDKHHAAPMGWSSVPL